MFYRNGILPPQKRLNYIYYLIIMMIEIYEQQQNTIGWNRIEEFSPHHHLDSCSPRESLTTSL
ncbi:hypothetical protein DERP_011926 [Dermatophagoides pteronyssinus]|uniref:Uncharacterized protein n=1 Tax=Dermatophagoides pteronyssinus TaxID=6956 RepID=A0ABQ8J2M3_DERPT|nr:hypothetical protein DERP_011926 [Dermatophagoides pteronyssinus]